MFGLGGDDLPPELLQSLGMTGERQQVRRYVIGGVDMFMCDVCMG